MLKDIKRSHQALSLDEDFLEALDAGMPPSAGIALAGILLFVAWNMGEWREFARLRHFLLPYRATLLGTFVLTVVFDLTVAVEVGLLMACGFFILRMSGLFSVTPRGVPLAPPGVVVFELYGALFFGAVAKIEAIPTQLPTGTRCVLLHMQRLISVDTSGIDALQQLHRTLARQQVALLLADVNPQPLGLLQRSGFAAELGTHAISPDLAQALLAAQAHCS